MSILCVLLLCYGIYNNPDNHDNPDNPDNPDSPDNPDNPDNPDSPDNPDNPDSPDSPDNPDNPDNSYIGGGLMLLAVYWDALATMELRMSNPNNPINPISSWINLRTFDFITLIILSHEYLCSFL